MRRYRSSSSSRTPPGNFHPKPSVAGFLPAKNYSYSYYQKTTIQTTTRTVKNSCSVVGRPRPRPLLPRETPFARSRFSTRKKRTTTTMISIATPSADGADAEEDEERMQWWWYYHSSRRAFLRVVLTEYRYAYVSVFAAERERERERERGTFARESCDDEKDRLKRSTTLLSLNIRAKAYERRTRYDVFSPRIVRCSLLLDSLLNSVLILLLQTLASMIGL